ncbi:MAG: hypothetical protein RL398_1422, partial [Planctomycetota bacterium]
MSHALPQSNAAASLGPGAPVGVVPEPAAVRGRATRLALLGSGFIADVHLQALKAVRDVEVVAICDPAPGRAERLAKRHGVARWFVSLDEMLAAQPVDAVHLLVPPGLHKDLALQCLAKGLHVFVEKPLALSSSDCAELLAAATQCGRVLAVNHNQTFHPSIVRLRRHLAAGRLGKLEHVELMHHVPLRQLGTGDVSHFMFQTEANILLEQGVHLFSMVESLLGPCEAVQVTTGERAKLANGVDFVAEWHVSMRCERGTAGVRMAFGKPWIETTVQAIGSDGAAVLDLVRGSCWLRKKTRWLEFLDHGINLASGSLHLAGRALGAVGGYCLSLFGLVYPDDPFLRGMRGAIEGFHRAVRGNGLAPSLSPQAAHAVLTMCERSAAAAGVATVPPPKPAAATPPGPARAGEVVVLGGTGFLGRRCVRLLREAGRPVTLVVRKPHLLPPELREGGVRVFVGDAADAKVLAAAFEGADAVLHLATVAGDDPARVEQVMADGVRIAANAARAAKVRRLVYTSSTAALWLGDRGRIGGDCGTDPLPIDRSAYARGKIAAEVELAAARRGGLSVTVVRPAIVVGKGGIREHSGVGLWVRDNQCVGWGRGDSPLPFVLADDCAKGLVAALDAPAAEGKDYNLAGDVRPTAQEYMTELAARSGRAYRFHPTPLRWMWLQELGK